MASNTIILRPDRMLRTGGRISSFPSDSGLDYVTAVNEVVADDDAGYVTGIMVTSEDGMGFCSYGVETPSKIPKSIIGARIYARSVSKTGKALAYVEVDGDDSFDRGNSDSVKIPTNSAYTTFVRELPNEVVAAINDSLSNSIFPILAINVYVYGSMKADSSDKLTQTYLEIDYEGGDIGIHKKVNGEWKSATAAYKKTNGAWAEITADECKAYLSSSFVTK